MGIFHIFYIFFLIFKLFPITCAEAYIVIREDLGTKGAIYDAARA